jgi:hypothetical protein
MHMSIRERKPNPSVMEILEGPPVLTCPPEAPDWLLPEAKRAWNRVSKELVARKMLTDFDLVTLGACCQNYARWKMYKKAALDGDPSAYPYKAMSRSAWKCFKSLCREFFLSTSEFQQIVEGLDGV